MLPKEKRDIEMGKLSMDLYLDSITKRYHAANRKEKGKILNELCTASGYHKKHAIRLLNQKKQLNKPDKKKRGRPPHYKSSVYLEPLKKIRAMGPGLEF